jgi:TolB-like protein
VPPIVDTSGPSEGSRQARSRSRRRRQLLSRAAALLVVSLGVVVLAFPWRPASPPPLSDRLSIAALPLSNGGDPRQDYFSDGLTEDLITSLGRFRSLFVIGRDSTFTYKRRHASPEQIGRELRVRYLVAGSVRRDAGNVRVTARLIDPGTGGQIWGESYDRALTGIFAVKDDVTQHIVTSLAAHLDRSELARVLKDPTSSPFSAPRRNRSCQSSTSATVSPCVRAACWTEVSPFRMLTTSATRRSAVQRWTSSFAIAVHLLP